MDEERQERIRYYSFAAFVGALLLLNVTGVWKTVFGIDTAVIITLLAGYKTFHNSISSLLEKRISADIALCIAVIAALSVGEYLAAAEAMFIVLVGEGLESYAAGRTEAAIMKFVEHLPRRARVLRDGEELEVAAEALLPGDVIVVRAGDRYAKYFLPALLLAAALTFYFTGNWLRTVAVLIVACPCALILATPTAMVAAIGGLARRGILVRSGSILELAAKVDTVIFDKTGTVTEGQFEIIRIIALDRDENELLGLAAAAERGSDHMLARVIVEQARARKVRIPPAGEASVLPGRGAECTIGTRVIRAGNAAFLAEHGVENTDSLLAEADRLGATAVLVAEGSRLAGAILLRDRLREGA